jgi:PAS domain S-box-containing protein
MGCRFDLRSLKSREALMLGIIGVGAIALGVIGLDVVERELIARAGESLSYAASEVAARFDSQVAERVGDIEIFAKAPQVRSTDSGVVLGHLKAIQQSYPVYRRLSVVGNDGRTVASTDPEWAGKDLASSPLFLEARQSVQVMIETVRQPDREDGPLSAVVFSVQIKGNDGRVRGVIMTEIDRARWQKWAAETIAHFENRAQQWGSVRYEILYSEGEVLLGVQSSEQTEGNFQIHGLPSPIHMTGERAGWVEEDHLARGASAITGYARMAGERARGQLPWGILVWADRDDVLASIRGVSLKLGLAGLGIFLPTFGLLIWSSQCRRMEQDKSASALRSLAESEVRTRTVLHDAMDAVVVMDAQGMISGWNRQAEVIFGWEMVEILGSSMVMTLVPPQYREAHAQGVARYLSTGEAKMLNKRIEISAIRKDGTEFPIELTITPLKLEQGMFFSAFIRDISERKIMIGRLRESETFFRLLSDQLPVGVFEINEEGRCLYKNKMWDTIMGSVNEEVFGFASAALPYGTWVEWVHPEDRPALTQDWAGAQANFSRLHAECRLAPNDGPERWVELQLWPMADDRGIRYLGTLEDITSRKKMMDRLRMSEAFFRLLSDHLPIGVFEIDYRGTCLYGNRMWLNLLTLADKADNCCPGAPGSWLQWFHSDDREKIEEEWERSRTTFDRVAVECRLAEGGEEARWVNVLLWPMTTEEGVRYLGTLEDITERKRTVARTMTLLRHGRFELQTLTEAKNLAELLAYAFPDPSRTQLGLTELLVNGVEHGNLGISYDEKSTFLDQGRFEAELIRRLALPEHRDKRVHITVERTDRNLEMTILDDGSGFDWRRYLDLDHRRADESHGRGIAMAKAVSFDQLDFQGCGNQVVVSVSLNGVHTDGWPEEGRRAA